MFSRRVPFSSHTDCDEKATRPAMPTSPARWTISPRSACSSELFEAPHLPTIAISSPFRMSNAMSCSTVLRVASLTVDFCAARRGRSAWSSSSSSSVSSMSSELSSSTALSPANDECAPVRDATFSFFSWLEEGGSFDPALKRRQANEHPRKRTAKSAGRASLRGRFGVSSGKSRKSVIRLEETRACMNTLKVYGKLISGQTMKLCIT
mmetsp:Transcript_2525/g.7952  ORF Transcript_2525/g.7952 Transcript_2525/m.7952 type:complete len:208 (-) Transcript_2525:1233-1856(-)